MSDREPSIILLGTARPPSGCVGFPLSILEAALPRARWIDDPSLPVMEKVVRGAEVLVWAGGESGSEEDWSALITHLAAGKSVVHLGGALPRRVADPDGPGLVEPEHIARLGLRDQERIPRGELEPAWIGPGAPPLPRSEWIQAIWEPVLPGPGRTWLRRIRPLAYMIDADGTPRASAALALEYGPPWDGARLVTSPVAWGEGLVDWPDAADWIRHLVQLALEIPRENRLAPEQALYRPGETPTLIWTTEPPLAEDQPELVLVDRDGSTLFQPEPGGKPHRFPVAPDLEPGLHRWEVRSPGQEMSLAEGALLVADEPVPGQPWERPEGLPVPPHLGLTYRWPTGPDQFLQDPDPLGWARQLSRLRELGFEVVRSGFGPDWTGRLKPDGRIKEPVLRGAEAFLRLALEARMPVIWNLFHGSPPAGSRKHAYLDKRSLERQVTLVRSVAERLGGLPHLTWNLIDGLRYGGGEDFQPAPLGGPAELRAWRSWLAQHYGTDRELRRAWRCSREELPSLAEAGLPDPAAGPCSHELRTFRRFARDVLEGWAERMVGALRDGGAHQTILVEPLGDSQPPIPGAELPWSVLAGEGPEGPLLVADAGRGSRGVPQPEQERLGRLQRISAVALGVGAQGVTLGIWQEPDRAPWEGWDGWGLLRPDGTVRPEREVMTAAATFARVGLQRMGPPQTHPVWVLRPRSESEPDSPLRSSEVALGILSRRLRLSPRLTPETRSGVERSWRLLVIPTATRLEPEVLSAVLDRVQAGAVLCISGGADRDPDGLRRSLLAPLGVADGPREVLSRWERIRLDRRDWTCRFPARMTGRELRPGGPTLQELPHGGGWVVYSPLPLEAAETPEVVAMVYQRALELAELEPELPPDALPPSVGSYWRSGRRGRCLTLWSEEGGDRTEELVCGITGCRIRLYLPAGRAALIQIARPSGLPVAAWLHGPLEVGPWKIEPAGGTVVGWDRWADGSLRGLSFHWEGPGEGRLLLASPELAGRTPSERLPVEIRGQEWEITIPAALAGREVRLPISGEQP